MTLEEAREVHPGEYQGHASWHHWNVCLWISNEYPLYRMARGARSGEDLLFALREAGVTETGDGAPYTLETVTAAWESVNED